MIEINLIPDVKLELLKAHRQQRVVISISVLIAIVSVAVVVLMSTYAFGVQTVADAVATDNIAKRTKELKGSKKDEATLAKTLTLQAQLSKLANIEGDKNISSRLFDILTVIIPTDENKVDIGRLAFDGEDSTIELEVEAKNGYEAMEVFKKTLAQTKFSYVSEGEPLMKNIASSINLGDPNYGEDSEGNRILRFTISFTYSEELFDATVTNGKIIGPTRQQATDSTKGVPASLFSSGGESE